MTPFKLRRSAAIGFAIVMFANGLVVAADPDTEPPITILEQIGPAVGWADVDVTFRAHSPGDPVTFECRLDAGPWVACVSPWHLADLAEGPHTVAVRATDQAGNTDPTPATETFLVDLTGPSGQLSINGGAESTGRTQVYLTMSNSDLNDTLHILISNRPNVDDDGRLVDAWDGYEWQLANWEYGWDLSQVEFGGTSGTGVKTVYLQFLDLFGNIGPVTSDSIAYVPAITPTTIRIGVTENPAEAGGWVGIRATLEAEDGAAIIDGRFTLGGCVDGTPQVTGGGRRVVLECWSPRLALGHHNLQAEFNGSTELATSRASVDLVVGPSGDATPPRIFLTPRGPLDSDEPQVGIDVHSSYDEAVAYECRLDGGAWVACGPIWTVARPAVGAHVLEARGRDVGGRWSVINAVLVWRVSPEPPLTYVLVNDSMVNAGFPTRSATLSLTLDPFHEQTRVVRISSSLELDAQGRLAKAVELPETNGIQIDWDLEDPATGGTSGDGRKWLILQAQRPDGTWEVPFPVSIRLDRRPPSLRLVINANKPFVDDNAVLILSKSDELNEIDVAYSTDRGDLEGSGINFQSGIASWPVGDIAPGSVKTLTIYARARDLAGNMSSITKGTITIDRSSPAATLDAPAFVLGSRVTTTRIPLKVGGSSKDTGSGVRRTTLQELLGDGGFASIAIVSGTNVTETRGLRPTTTGRYRIRASDQLGHVGTWKTGPTIRPHVVDDASPTITFGPGWRRAATSPAIGPGVRRSATSGARMDYRFTGRAIAIISPQRATLGRARVYIDGRYVKTVDLRGGANGTQRVVFRKKWATSGQHRLTIKVVATSGRPFDLDAIAVIP